uniref:ATP synthase FO subunit 8 n=1 Tax=Ulva rigida TaxID=75689 RepID=A0A7L9R4T0_9CHLO|nr:ATP synthase FO subunit 8 [Ulva rigida]QOL10395.1 ATP synthase FO subunit 8 [Ulva rigida]
MPQLDALTYFSQYVYLFITFSAVYYYVLHFIIPKIVSTLKIRQKLNSFNLSQAESYTNTATNFERGDSDSTQLLEVLNQHYKQPSGLKTSDATLQYNHLLNQAWLANTSQATAAESANKWLNSTVALQLAHNLRFKKLLCDHIVRRITPN